MRINKFIQDVSSRYSCHVITISFLLVVSLTICLFYYAELKGYEAQLFMWYIIILYNPVIVPVFCTFIFCLCYSLYITEENFPDFRINKQIRNPIIKIAFFITFILGVLVFLVMICETIVSIIYNDKIRGIFVLFGIPAMISILPINLFFYKFLHNKVLHKK